MIIAKGGIEMVFKKIISLAFLILVIVSIFIAGCNPNIFSHPDDTDKEISSSSVSTKLDEDEPIAEEPDYPEVYMVTNMNYFDYQPGLECSAFASAYVLRHFGEEAEGLELFKDFPGKLPGGAGVYPSGVEQFWNDLGGYTAEFKSGGTIYELKRLVSTGVPIIVFIHVEEPYTSTHNTHFLPLVGYDSDYLYFAESLEYLANCKDEPDMVYNRKTEISKFERLWTNIDSTWDNPYFVIKKTNSSGEKE